MGEVGVGAFVFDIFFVLLIFLFALIFHFCLFFFVFVEREADRETETVKLGR